MDIYPSPQKRALEEETSTPGHLTKKTKTLSAARVKSEQQKSKIPTPTNKKESKTASLKRVASAVNKATKKSPKSPVIRTRLTRSKSANVMKNKNKETLTKTKKSTAKLIRVPSIKKVSHSL